MTTGPDKEETLSKLFSLLELKDATKLLSNLLIEKFGFHTVGFIIWDEDLEEFVDECAYGKSHEVLTTYLKDSAEEIDKSSGAFESLNIDGLGSCLRVVFPDCACMVLSGDVESESAEIESFIFKEIMAPVVLSNAWQFTELIRENHRLRSSYDELEDKTTKLEDETRKLINDFTVKDSIRTKQLERDRLVYWISHLTRSSLKPQQVLETAVEKVGTELSLSRCHLLRSGTDSEIEIYDYCDGKVPPIKKQLLRGEGLEFTRAAMSVKIPRHLDDHKFEEQDKFNAKFLEKLGMRSGLVQPIIMREEVIGSLFLEDCAEPREWSIDDMSLIASVADNLAVAIENAELHREVEKQSVTDGLTGVSNRRSFNDALDREFERARRYNQDLSLIVVDLDYLKKINDTYGHMTGDEAIKAIGHVLAQSSRSTDITARYGGEEFCVLLPNTDIEMAEQLGERLRRLIADTMIEGPGNLSASLGVASYPMHADSSDMLFLRADEALYRAKQDGRNCIRVSCLDPKGINLGESSGGSKQSLVPEKT